MQRGDPTEDLSGLSRMERWQYYTSSYVSVEPTEGIDRSRVGKPLLTRNAPPNDSSADEGGSVPKPLVFKEELSLRICVNTAKIIYSAGGAEYFLWIDKPLGVDSETGESNATQRLKQRTAHRASAFEEKFVMNNQWMKGKDHDQVAEATQAFMKWVEKGDSSSASPST